jgi:hypothetical protein
MVLVLVTDGAVRATPVPPVIVLALEIAPPAPLSVRLTVVAAFSGPHVESVKPAPLSVAAMELDELKLPIRKSPVVTATLIAPEVVPGLGSQTHPRMLLAVTEPAALPTLR